MSSAGELFRRLHEDATQDPSVLEEIVSPRYCAYGQEVGPAYLAHTVAALRCGFPDLRVRVEQVAAADGIASGALVMTGRNDGTFQGRPPTGRPIEVRAMSVIRVRDALIVASDVLVDRLELLQQLGWLEGSRWRAA